MQDILLSVHIVSGFLALIGGLLAAISKTGKFRHRVHVIGGTLFVLGMAIVCVTAFPLALWGRGLFFLFISAFSLYCAFSGWRYARNRDGSLHLIDRVSITAMFLIAIAASLYGMIALFGGKGGGIFFLVFGSIAAALAGIDYRSMRKSVQGKQRIARHLTMMLSGFIAAVTAFVVNNVTMQPPIIPWLLPTILITPFIVWWNRRLQNSGSASSVPEDPT